MPVFSTNDSPASPLASLRSQRATDPRLLLVTGPSGSGKTTWCRALVAQARSSGLTVGGLLSPADFTGGRKVAIDLLNLTTGDRRRLAVPRREGSARAVATGEWAFDPATLDWGNRALDALQAPQIPFLRLLVLDELGPLEFHRGQGLQRAFPLIEARRYALACVTVRPGLLEEARRRWPAAGVLDVAVRQPQTGRM